MDDDKILLRRFVESRDDDVFAKIVRRHLGLVYSAALRRVGGDVHLAEEVAQMVFVDVARKVARLVEQRSFAAWLYTATQYAAAKVVRTEQGRRRREEASVQDFSDDSALDAEWASIRPVLDDAMLRLKPREREAVVMRFFDGRGFAEIGDSLDLSESGARMRVERALDKLRNELNRRGVRSTASALGLALSAHAVAAPPAGVAVTITSTALSTAAAGGGAAAIFSFITMTKTQIGIVAGIALAGTGVVAVQHQAQAELEDAIFRAQQEEEARIESLDASMVDRERTITEFNALLQATAAEIESLQNEIEIQQAEIEEITASHRSRSNASRKGAGDSTVFGLAELDEYPVMVEQVRPVYPEVFKGTNLPGRVSLEFVVGADGEVIDARAIEATHPEFAAAAIEAVLNWKFDPGIVEGASVNTRVRQVIQFQPGENASWF